MTYEELTESQRAQALAFLQSIKERTQTKLPDGVEREESPEAVAERLFSKAVREATQRHEIGKAQFIELITDAEALLTGVAAGFSKTPREDFETAANRVEDAKQYTLPNSTEFCMLHACREVMAAYKTDSAKPSEFAFGKLAGYIHSVKTVLRGLLSAAGEN